MCAHQTFGQILVKWLEQASPAQTVAVHAVACLAGEALSREAGRAESRGVPTHEHLPAQPGPGTWI